MEILKIYLEEQLLLIKYCVIKHYQTINIDKNLKYDVYQRGLALMVYKFFHKSSSGGDVKSEIMPSQELAEILIKKLLELLEIKKYIHLLKTVFGLLVLVMCNY